MPGSDDIWRPRRILAFLAVAALLYAALFLWSDAILRKQGRQNPFQRIATAPERVDWIILGGGNRSSKLRVAPSVLAALPSVQVIEGLAFVRAT